MCSRPRDALALQGSPTPRGKASSGSAYDIDGRGGGISGTTAAHANRIKNADFSRGAMFWGSVDDLTVQPIDSPYVTARAALSLTVDPLSTQAHIFQNFLVDSGVRTVTVNVRYLLRTAGVNAFRFELRDVASNTRLGFFSDVGPGVTDWRVRSLTGRFDGLAGGVVGPRELQVRIYPYNGNPFFLSGQQVYLDSVWLVEGGYAATYRPYTEGVEVLVDDDREIFFSGITSATVGPVAAMPTNVPSNAIAMVVEIRISADEATTWGGTITVNDQQGSDPLTIVSATFDLRITTVEVTIPITPGLSPVVSPIWTVFPNNPANSVNYRVRLKKWILRQ